MNWYIQAQILSKTDMEVKEMLETYVTAQAPDKEALKQAIIAKLQAATPTPESDITPTPANNTAEDANWTAAPALEVKAQITTIDSKETESLHEVTIILPRPTNGWTIAQIRSALRNRILHPYFIKNKVVGVKAIATILMDESLVQETTAKFRYKNVPMEQWNQDDFQMFAIENALIAFPKPNTTSLAGLRDWIARNGAHDISRTLPNESDK